MYRLVEIIFPKRPRREPGKGFVEEAPIRGRVRHVGREVNRRRVHVEVGGNVRHRGQKVVHHPRVVRVVDGGSYEPTLHYVAPEEGPAEGDVVQVQEGGAVRENGVYVDVLDVGEVGHDVVVEVEVTQVLDGAVLGVDAVQLQPDLVEGVAGLPLPDYAQEAQGDGDGEDGAHFGGDLGCLDTHVLDRGVALLAPNTPNWARAHLLVAGVAS